MMHRNKSVDAHQFAMVPRADIPRSSFRMQHTHKTTFDAGYLIPILIQEVLPGDTFKCSMTGFARLATPIFPVMDNLHMDTFFFFVPNRLVWDNWIRFMGEQDNPSDSVSYVVPAMTGVTGGYPPNSIYDYMGLPTTGQYTPGLNQVHHVLPLRAYNLIYNQWFRDENLNPSAVVRKTDAGDLSGDFNLLRRSKRPDYFTTALPWPQKGNTAVSLPLGTSAPVKSDGNSFSVKGPTGGTTNLTSTGAGGSSPTLLGGTGAGTLNFGPVGQAAGLYADLSTATAATINQLRQAFQIQKLLERDARGGSRYIEIIRAHFGVVSPDARHQRPEYLGGGSSPIIVNPIAQTSATGLTGGSTPAGSLAAMGTGLAHNHGFTQSFTEHGYIIGLVSVRADITYQQGQAKHWNRSTKYDFYWPAFATLGEQTVLNREIYADGSANDIGIFGYQERFAEYRYTPSRITGLFKSTSTGTIDPWHLAQKFTALPTLGPTFIADTPPLSRVLAVGAGANGQQIIFDSFFDITAARPMPMYGVPGLIDHF